MHIIVATVLSLDILLISVAIISRVLTWARKSHGPSKLRLRSTHDPRPVITPSLEKAPVRIPALSLLLHACIRVLTRRP